MSKKFKISVVGLLVIVVMAAMASGTVLAQEETPDETTPQAPERHAHGRGFGRGGMMGGEVALEAAAEVLGMTADELSTQLWGGKTLADLAEEAGVDLQDVQDAVEAAQEQATRDAIEQAVEDGDLTREHADWLLEGLDNGYLGGHGCGGFGGPKGFGGFQGNSSFQGRGGFQGHGGFRGNGGFQRPAFSSDADL